MKLSVAKAAGISDHNRLGIYDPATKKTLKDRKARIADQEAIIKHGEVLVKDMGKSQIIPRNHMQMADTLLGR